MTKKEKKVVLPVFDALAQMPYNELNKIIGSITIDEMYELYYELYYEDYCKSHGIRHFKDMTDDDRVNAYMEGY